MFCILEPTRPKRKNDVDLIEVMRFVKRQLVTEFGVYNIATMLYALDTFDEMIVSITTNKIDDFLEQNNTLRERIFCLISFKHFVDTNDPETEPQID